MIKSFLSALLVATVLLVAGPISIGQAEACSEKLSYGTVYCTYDKCMCYFVRTEMGGFYNSQLVKVYRCGCCGREYWTY